MILRKTAPGIIIALFVTLQVASVQTFAAPSALKSQTTCPVMGGAIDRTQYVDYQGKRIYVCCAMCKAQVAKDPARYIAQLAAAGQGVETIALQKAVPKSAVVKKQPKPQTVCPVLGTPIDKSLFVDYQGKRIYVCCTACLNKVRKNPARYIEKIEKAGESVEIIHAAKTPGSDAPHSGTGTMKM